MTHQPTHDQEMIWQIIRSLHRAAKLQQRTPAASELGHASLGVLNAATIRPSTPSSLAGELAMPAQTVTRAIAELEAANLITRVADPDDGRSYIVESTADGIRTITEFRQRLTEQFAAHLSDWELQEVELFASQLAKLIESLEGSKPGSPVRERRPNPWR